MHDSPPATTSNRGSSSRIHRRHALRALCAATLLLRSRPRSAQADEMVVTVWPVMVGETFVGRTSDPEVFIAVVLGAEPAMAYLCDGARHRTNVWFSGAIRNDHLALTTADGARLEGRRTPASIEGSAELGG